MSRSFTREVEVDVDLSDFETDELLEEIESRGQLHKRTRVVGGKFQLVTDAPSGASAVASVKLLQMLGCPAELLFPVSEWAEEHARDAAIQPFATKERLEQWNAWVKQMEV
jgi:hypothetical protein